jgi:hypothetical protein
VITAGRAPGWVNLNFATPVRLAPGAYWLGLHSGGTSGVGRYAAVSSTAALRFNADPYSDGSSTPFGTANTDAKRMSLHAIGG